jgi:hypothetical protein
MLKPKIYVITVLILSLLLSAKTVTVIGEYEYKYADTQSFVDAMDFCLERAKKDAVEKFASSISSVTIVKDNMMQKDQIVAVTLGVIKNLKYLVKEEDKDKNRIYYKISGDVDEDQVIAKLEEKLNEIKEITLLEGDVSELIFALNTEGVYISKDGRAPIISNTKYALFRIAKGKHNFTFIKDGYKEHSKDINLTGDIKYDIALEKGENTKKLKLPSIVRLNSNPVGAEVFLNEQKIGVTPIQYNLQPGFYDLKVKKDMYHTKLTDFTVKEGETYEVPVIDLKPRFGTLEVKSDPADSKIYVDGVFEGYSPLKKEMFLSGNHSVTAEYELYHSESQDFHLADGEKKNLSLKLKQAYGELIVNSNPSGARVFIDDIEMGVTPYKNSKIASKLYKVRLDKKFYSEVTKNAEVKDALSTTLDFVLDMNVGVIDITAENSDIFINGNKLGNNRIKVNMPGGNYTITARRQYHKDDSKTIDLSVGEEKKIDLKPEPILGSLSVISEPFNSKGAKIFIDQEFTGKTTPSVFPLLIGDHTIKLTHPEFLDKENNFTLRQDEEKKITLNMITYAGSQKAKKDFWKTQKWIALGSSVVLAGSGLYCGTAADGYYNDYLAATSTDKAVDFYDKSTNFDLYKDISYGVSISSLGYFFYAWYMESRY